MSDKYVNETGLTVVRDWANGKFALDADLDTLSDRVDEIIAEGGEPNVIETVKVNNTALTPDAQKAVNVEVPTSTSDLSNNGDGSDSSSPFATQAYVAANGGKIDTISVNNTPQTITNKNVNITVPTKVSDITNDSGFQTATDVATTLANSGDPYQTESDVDSAISTAITSAYKYKGSVATYQDLPASGNTTGDVWDVQTDGMNYAWTGTGWDALGQYVDTSVLWTSTAGQSNSLVAMTTAEINAILNASV